MNFLSTFFFWLIPLASIPLIIHLLNKRNIKTIDFSSIQFLKFLETESIRKLQFLQLLLMIIRTLIILLIIIMMTRPAVGGMWKTFNSHQDNHNIIIIDDTFSTSGMIDGIERSEIIINILDAVLSSLQGKSEITVYTLTKGKIYSGLLENVIPIKNLITGTYEGLTTEIFSKIITENKNNNKLIDFHLITDGDLENANVLHSYSQIIKNWNLYLYKLPELSENLSITSVDIENEILLPNNKINISATIKNNGIDSVEGKLIQLFIDGMSVAQQLISLEANEIKEFNFETALPSTGQYSCIFSVEEDDKAGDNKYYFNLNIPDNVHIGYFSETGFNSYLNQLINSINFNGNILVLKNYNSQNILQALHENEIIIIDSYSLYNRYSDDFLYFVHNGGHLLIFPNESDSDFENISLDEFYDNIFINNHENFNIAHIENDETDENTIKLFKYFELPKQNSKITDELGNSIHNQHLYGNGIVDVFGINLSLNWSNFPIKGSFIPYFHRLLYSNYNDNYEIVEIGDNWNIKEKYQSSYYMSYKSPDEIEVKIGESEKTINYFKIPGIHSLQYSELESEIKAINISKTELEYFYSPQLYTQQYNEFGFTIIDYSDNITVKLQETKVGTEIWRLILFLIILLVIIEMILSSNAVTKTSN